MDSKRNIKGVCMDCGAKPDQAHSSKCTIKSSAARLKRSPFPGGRNASLDGGEVIKR